jgi:hypothetical protein
MLSQIALKAPASPAEDTISDNDQVVFINGLNLIADQAQRYSHGYTELLVIVENAITHEGKVVDLLCPGNGGFATVLQILNLHFPSQTWRYVEAKDKPAEVEAIAA